MSAFIQGRFQVPCRLSQFYEDELAVTPSRRGRPNGPGLQMLAASGAGRRLWL